MKMIIFVAVALAAVAVAALPEPPKILKSEFDSQPEGGYHFAYETEDGISRSEKGELKQTVDEENQPLNVVVVRGSYSYVDPEGKLQQFNYVADENGFQLEGQSISQVSGKK
ncbi:hypothetical protein O3G_MSEX007338 [Manduca sexta]|nr:hypothetical protein O3G_MSEX007338 [Manduca sexta]